MAKCAVRLQTVYISEQAGSTKHLCTANLLIARTPQSRTPRSISSRRIQKREVDFTSLNIQSAYQNIGTVACPALPTYKGADVSPVACPVAVLLQKAWPVNRLECRPQQLHQPCCLQCSVYFNVFWALIVILLVKKVEAQQLWSGLCRDTSCTCEELYLYHRCAGLSAVFSQTFKSTYDFELEFACVCLSTLSACVCVTCVVLLTCCSQASALNAYHVDLYREIRLPAVQQTVQLKKCSRETRGERQTPAGGDRRRDS